MSHAALMSISLSRNQKLSLVQQLYGAILDKISAGRLSAGFRMPSTREFAKELGVSRSTVIAAYDQLAAEGFLNPKRGSGLYVQDIGSIDHLRWPVEPSNRQTKEVPRFVETPTEIRPFANGMPDMRLFPYQSWGREVARVARLTPWAFVENEAGFGDLALRDEIARHLLEWRGIAADPRQIVITAGAGDALEIIARTLVSQGDHVALEDPGYLPIRNIVVSVGGTPIWMSVDRHGAVFNHQQFDQKRPALFVLTPSFQFPLGVTMPTARKNEYLQYATRHDSWIVEDDFDSEFRYSGAPLISMASGDGLNRVIYVGSFSKIFSSGLRIGFMAMPEQLQPAVSETIARFGSRASSAPQRALANFMHNGELHRHLRKMRRLYAVRRQKFIGLLDQYFDGIASHNENNAGMQVAVQVPKRVNDVQLSQGARSIGLSIAPLSQYYSHFEPQNGMLLGYCGFEPSQMEAPMQQLRALYDQLANSS